MLPRFFERIEAAFERLRGYELSCIIVFDTFDRDQAKLARIVGLNVLGC